MSTVWSDPGIPPVASVLPVAALTLVDVLEVRHELDALARAAGKAVSSDTIGMSTALEDGGIQFSQDNGTGPDLRPGPPGKPQASVFSRLM